MTKQARTITHTHARAYFCLTNETGYTLRYSEFPTKTSTCFGVYIFLQFPGYLLTITQPMFSGKHVLFSKMDV